MQHVTTISEFRNARAELEGTVAFVPTLGFLHDGHLSLMKRGLKRCDHLVVSVFVNPTQFGPDEDLDSYPRDMEGDKEKCRRVGCDVFFAPEPDQIYDEDHTTWVNVDKLDRFLCGASRTGHFEGVATVVTKLFNIVEPDAAVFGQKDYQQLAIIRRLVRDLNYDIDVIAAPTVREEDGLAVSSRNRYLTDDQRHQASCLSRGLVAAHGAYREDPDRPSGELIEAARRPIEDAPDAEVDYIECVDPDTLLPHHEHLPAGDGGAVIAMAVHLGDARLIDNLRLDAPLPEGPLRSLQ